MEIRLSSIIIYFPYLQVDLGELLQITGVATQGSEHYSMWVRSYTLAFSQDGRNYNTYAGNGLVARVESCFTCPLI